MFERLTSWLRALAGRSRFEDGMSEELRVHVELYADDLERGGMPRDEALRRARIEFGKVDNVKDDCREARGLRLADGLVRHTRHAVRMMRRSPGFTFTALATIAVCLGANLTIFAVVDSVVLRPLPFPAAERLMSVFNTYPKAGVPNDGCSLTNYYERRGRIGAFSHLAAYRDGTSIFGETGATERVPTTRVSPEFFETLGVSPALGRGFTEAETSYRTDRVAVLTDSFWRQRLNADPNVLGRTIRLDGGPVTVVGVLPPQFRFLSSKTKLYLPLASNPDERTPKDRHSGNSDMIARLTPVASVEQAQLEIDAHNAALEADHPMAQAMAEAGFRSIVVPLHADHVASARPVLLIVQAGALVLLLIGAVNLTNLLLVRAGARAKERAVRRAIGAGRRHIVAEVLVETVLLTLIGGFAGLLAGAGGVRLLAFFGVEHLPLGARIAFDARTACTALAASVVLGFMMGLPLAWYSVRDGAANPLQAQSRSSTASRAAERMRRGFVVAQIALAFVLLAGAGLLGLSLKKAMAMPPGFRPEHVLSGQLSISGKAAPNGAALLAIVERIGVELSRQPGAQTVGIATNVPLSGRSNKSAVTVGGYVRKPGESLRGHYAYSVGGDFFAALGMTLIDGRFLTAADSRTTERVCVVDDDFARRYWPKGGALGHRLFAGGGVQPAAQAFTIVGIVGAMKQADLTETEAQGAAFFPFAHRMDGDFYVVARTSLAPELLASTLQAVVRSIDPELPVSDLLAMDRRVADSLAFRRSPAAFAGLFAAMALLLTAIGTYGVLSYAVLQRRREIGLRIALGARPAQVRGEFLAIAIRLVVGGTAFGLFGAWLLGRAMQAILFQVSALHPATLAATAIVLATVSVAACLVPSHRAARISPMVAMSGE
jgi:predicted permease